ncbi:MAG: DUF4340 domain-containing protein [Prolixibacteraceae bacterium]|nr:DUF4340 domain-containing protein [Prolixibacteraceae bacterium]
MYRKLNIKILAIIFSILMIVVVLTEMADSRKGGRTFREELVDVSPDEVTSLEISPKVEGNKVIKLLKENDSWFVESGDKRYRADPSLPSAMINELNSMKPESVVATGDERRVQYEVTDSLGTRVKLFSGNNLLADLIIGKFSFSQPQKMTSYIRLEGDKVIYGVDGMLGMSFNRNVDSFRDRTVVKSNSSDWSRLVYKYPADSSFTLEKAAEGWTVNGQPADSASVAEYFSAIRNLSDSRFAENKTGMSVTHSLLIEGNNDMEKVEINGYYQEDGVFMVESSQNRGNIFESKELAEKIFISSSSLLE